jgi:TolB-like protein
VLYLFENYALDTDRRELRCGSAPVSVEPQVFDLLAYLIENRHRVVSKDDLLAVIWHGRLVSDSALTSRVNAARGALGDSGNEQRLIKTHLRKGIRFVGEVREEREGTSIPVAAGQPDRGPPALTAERAPQERKPALTLPEKPSIAVLPFTNMSDDPQQDYFADGMAEEIITALSRCRWLFVIARNSTFTYKGKSVDVREVGRDLGVRYVLEGSVRRAGDRLRFTGQLIDTTSGTISGPIASRASSATCSDFRIALPKASSPRLSPTCSSPRSSGSRASQRPILMPMICSCAHSGSSMNSPNKA